jgi:hypothetical protein
LFIVTQLLMLAGSWLLTEPDPSGLGEDKYGRSRKIIRFALVVGLINTVLENVLRTGAIPPDLRLTVQVFNGIAAIIGLIGYFAMLNYLSKLALRIPDQVLAGRARTIMYGIGVSYGIIIVFGIFMAIAGRAMGTAAGSPAPMMFAGCIMMIAVIVLLIFGIRYILLLDSLRRRFGEQAEAAEQSWARAAGDSPVQPA